jgi:hypothetical protein
VGNVNYHCVRKGVRRPRLSERLSPRSWVGPVSESWGLGNNSTPCNPSSTFLTFRPAATKTCFQTHHPDPDNPMPNATHADLYTHTHTHTHTFPPHHPHAVTTRPPCKTKSRCRQLRRAACSRETAVVSLDGRSRPWRRTQTLSSRCLLFPRTSQRSKRFVRSHWWCRTRAGPNRSRARWTAKSRRPMTRRSLALQFLRRLRRCFLPLGRG